jgi:hypothetical protein
MKLKMQSQDMKSCNWEIINQAMQAGVPGLQEVVAAFMKQHYVHLFSNK